MVIILLMLAVALSQLNRIDFKRPSGASEGNYITSKLTFLKWLLWLQEGDTLKHLSETLFSIDNHYQSVSSLKIS